MNTPSREYEAGDFSHLVNMHGWREKSAHEHIEEGRDAEYHEIEHQPGKTYLQAIQHDHPAQKGSSGPVTQSDGGA